jgi:hypothetical protein
MSIGIVVPPLIYGVMVTVWGIDPIFIFADLISLPTLIPFWLLVLRSRPLKPPLGTEGKKPTWKAIHPFIKMRPEW